MNLLKDIRKKEWFWLENDLVDRTDLTIYEKMVYVVLARYASNDSSCFPSYNTIADKCGCSLRKTKDVITSLEEKGLITKQIRIKNGKKENDSNLYYIASAKKSNREGSAPHAPGSAPHAPGSAPHAPGSASYAPGVVHDMHSKNTNTKNTNIKRLNTNTTQSKENLSVVDRHKELIEKETHLKIDTSNKINKVRKWDKERLLKAIDIFKEKDGKYFSLLEKIYADDGNFIKKEAPQKSGATPNKSISNKNENIPSVKTRYHNINQTFTKYTPEELEKLLLENQKDKFTLPKS